jgi:hypothetical protein
MDCTQLYPARILLSAALTDLANRFINYTIARWNRLEWRDDNPFHGNEPYILDQENDISLL